MLTTKDLTDFTTAVLNRALQSRFEREEQLRKDVDEFRAIDFGRAIGDKEYARRLDEHFGEGWMDRIKWKFSL